MLFGAPRPENRPPDGAPAGVDDGVVEEAVPPSEKRGFCGVAVDVVAVVEGCEVVVAPREGKRGFDVAWESVPAAGNLKAGACVLGVEVAGAVPKRGFAPVSEVVVAAVP